MTEPEDKPKKWEKDQIFWFVAVMVFLFVVVPLLILWLVFHKFSKIDG